MQTPIRILCVFSNLNRGGAESMCMNLYRHIDKNKIQFDFVKHTSVIGHFEDEIHKLGGKIYTAPRYKIYNHLSYVNWWKKHLLLHPEYKIIHGHFFTISAVFFKVAKKLGRVTIGHSHSTSSGRNVIKQLYLKKVEKYSDYCLACGQQAGKWLFPHKTFDVLNNAINVDDFKYNEVYRKEIREGLGINDELLIGTVGNLHSIKNPFGIIEIFKNVCTENPNARLLWVGAGDLKNKIEQKLDEENIRDKVFLMGSRPDVNKLLQAMDIFILPSFFEGLGIASIEAQTAGLKCFLSDKVPTEAAVTNLCEFLSLNDYKIWAKKILSTKCDRSDTQNSIKKSGYDIINTVEWLTNYYYKIYETKGQNKG